jgi:hypothetical protein
MPWRELACAAVLLLGSRNKMRDHTAINIQRSNRTFQFREYVRLVDGAAS